MLPKSAQSASNKTAEFDKFARPHEQMANFRTLQDFEKAANLSPNSQPHFFPGKTTIDSQFVPRAESTLDLPGYRQLCPTDQFQSITVMRPFRPLSFEELRLADYGKLEKSNMSSNEFFGLPTAPTTPQTESTHTKKRETEPLPCLDFGKKPEEKVQAAQPASLFSSQPSNSEAVKEKQSAWLWPPQTAKDVSMGPEESSASSSMQSGKEVETRSTPLVNPLFSPNFRADAAASRSFFGLSTAPAECKPEVEKSIKRHGNRQPTFSFSNEIGFGSQTAQVNSLSPSKNKGVDGTLPSPSTGTSPNSNNTVKVSESNSPSMAQDTPSLFSTLPSSSWNVKGTKPALHILPSGPTAMSNKSSSWFNSLSPPQLDTSSSQSTSFLNSFPKATSVSNFTFSKFPEQPLGSQKSSDAKTSFAAPTETANMSVKVTEKVDTEAQKNVSAGPASLGPGVTSQKQSKNSSSVLKSSAQPATVFSFSKMGNELSTEPSLPTSTMTDQNKSGYQDPFESFRTMATSLLPPTKDAVTVEPKSAPPVFNFKNTLHSTSSTSGLQTPIIVSTKPMSVERQKYMSLHHSKDNKSSGADEQLRTTPLLSLSAKENSEAKNKKALAMFPQYAFLGCRIPDAASSEGGDDTDQYTLLEPEPILLNTNTPWSAFICGSQGSGKSYSLSAIIENCLYASPKIGRLPKPLAGVVFHNNTASANNICEAAHLVSLDIKVNVLVSRSNYHALSSIYKKAVSPKAAHLLNIQPLVLQSHHLTAERMHRLMAFQESENTVPLYMEVIMRILREMAITGLPFNYATFKVNLDNEGLQPGQKVMMDMRLNLLESFMDPSCIRPTRSAAKKTDLFSTAPATLTIVDLSDPFLDSSTTCTLFDILLSLFLSSRPKAGMLICLDEAHKFMKNTPAAETFTENLLTVIREQRHNACRVVIATQEPTISPKLLDLCSITMVHRFTSPDWLATLRGHLAGASDLVTSAEGGNKKIGAAKLFEKIINLDVGESLLFAPSAVLGEAENGEVEKLGTQFVKFKTRVRLGRDGGQSILAVRE